MISPATMNLNTGGNRVGRWSSVKMSALGHKQTCATQQPMSAKGQKRSLSLWELFTDACRGIQYHIQHFIRFGEHRNVTGL